MDDLKAHIRQVPDFPKPGILFYDISTLLNHADAWRATVDRMAEAASAFRPDLLHVEVRDDGTPLPLDRDGTRPASVAGRSLELFDALALAWDSSAPPDRPGHVVWFDLEA